MKVRELVKEYPGLYPMAREDHSIETPYKPIYEDEYDREVKYFLAGKHKKNLYIGLV